MASPEPCQVDDGGSHLLSLPAELRNHIYREVLVSAEKIYITKDSHEAPGLLRVNRQIRAETRSIYYKVNWFSIKCPDFDVTALVAFRQQSKDILRQLSDAKRFPSMSVSCEMGQPRNWENLLKWAEARHRDPGVCLFHCGSDPGRRVGLAVVELASSLRDVPWDRVKKIVCRLVPTFPVRILWR